MRGRRHRSGHGPGADLTLGRPLRLPTADSLSVCPPPCAGYGRLGTTATPLTITGDDNEGSWLLIADADNTLLGDRAGLRQLKVGCEAAGVRIVVNTSRPLPSIDPDIPSWLAPVGVIAAMGTQIRLEGTRVRSWESRFEGWDRDSIRGALLAAGFTPHREELQARFKVSFEVPPDRSDRARELVQTTGQPSLIVESGVADFDVIPAGAGKRAAAEFVAARLGAHPERVATAGDSLNDIDMLHFGNGIVVGNASPGLRARAATLGLRPMLGHRAHGVLEGLRRMGAVS